MPDNPSFPTGTVTFLFSDIEGSTQLLQGLGERYDAVLSAHNRILREAFSAYGGAEVGTEGDSFFVVFPGARAAIDAAVAAQRGLLAHDFGQGVKVRVRMGLHTGEGRLVDGNYRGLDVHRAARIAAAGHGGQVLVSETTRALVEGSPGEPLSFTDLGEHRLKDLEHPDRLYQLTAPGLLSSFPPPRSMDARPNNLVAPVSSFVGREREVREVRKQLQDNRLVTLTGPGGTGKSRLALQVAHEMLPDFKDGVFLVPLASISDPELLAPAVAQTLGVRQQGVGTLEAAVRQHVATKDLLLILDNFEQLMAGAFFVSDLLGSTTHMKVLVTSRAPLRLSWEQEYPVPPLSLPPSDLADRGSLEASEAVRLFVQRAKAVRPDFHLTSENAYHVAEICRRLDGLPLALELAAARMRTLEPAEVARRLNRSLSLLTGGPRDLPARQQTLRNAIAWSYELLDEPLKDLFAKLGVFAGGFSLDAAEAICCDDALDQLERLAEQSLVRTTIDQFGARYVMLGPVREYARERLEETGAAAETLRRYAEYFLSMAEKAQRLLQGATQVEWLGRLEQENDNLRAVMAWALENREDAMAARLGWALWLFWWLHGHQQEGRTSMEALLSHNPPDAERCSALSVAGSMALVQADHFRANAWFRDAIALARKLGDEQRLAFCLQSLGLSSLNIADWETATASSEEALRLHDRHGNLMMASGARTNLGTAAFMQGRLDEAESKAQEGLAIARRIRDPLGTYFALYTLAQTALARDDLDRAASLLREGLAVAGEVGNPIRVTYYLETYALVLGVAGDLERSVRLLGAAEALRRKAAVPRYNYLEAPAELRRRALGAARSGLGPPGYEKAWSEGLAITAPQAIAYALDRTWEEAAHPDGPFGELEVEPVDAAPPIPARPASAGGARPAEAVAPPPALRAQTVGRQAELARAETVLRAAEGGHGRALLISGEPGIGKSRLAEEIANRAEARGFVTAAGGAIEGSGAPAYGPWVAALAALGRRVPVHDMGGRLGGGAAELAKIVPSLGIPVDPAPSAGNEDPDARRQQLFEAVAALLKGISSRRPVLIMLEDLQWADVATLQLTSYLAPHLRGSRIVVTATYRPDEVSAEDPLAETLATLARHQVAEHLELAGLDAGGVAQLVSRLTGSATAPELASTIQSRTGGNAFFVTELARLLTSDSGLAAGAAGSVPASVREVIGQRLGRLPAETNALLSTAAVVGRRFDLAVVAAAFNLDVDRTLDLVEAAVAGGVVTEDPTEVGTFRFSHDLVREAIIDGLSATRRAILHGNVAEALEATHGEATPPLELAYHLAEAAPAIGPRRAIPHLLRAAELAASGLAHEQAEELLRRAQELAASLPLGDFRDRQELEILMRLNLLAIQTGGYAAPQLAEGLPRARALAERLGESRALIPVRWGMISFHNNDGDTRTARRLADELLEDVTPGGEPSELLAGHLGVGIISMFQGEFERARDHFAKVMELAQGRDDPWLGWMHQDPTVNCATFQAWCLAVLGESEGAASAGRLAVDRAAASGKDFDLAHALYFASAVPVFERRIPDARRMSEEAVSFAREKGFPSYAALSSIFHGWVLAVEGEPQAGVAEITGTLEAMAGFARTDHSIFLALLAEAHGLAGEPAAGVEVADRGLGVIPKTGERFYESELHRIRGELLYQLGRERQAEAQVSLETALAVAGSQGARLLEARARKSLERHRG